MGALALAALLIPVPASRSGAAPKPPAKKAPQKKDNRTSSGASATAAAATPAPNSPPVPLTRLYSFALYQLGYRACAPQSLPSLLPQNADGSTRLTHLPLDGVGPWMDSARSSWHRAMLSDMARIGVNTALVDFPSSESSRREWARQGLDMAVQALRELHDKGQAAPTLALYLDLNGTLNWDLSRPAGRQALFALIRDFYRRVPSAYQAGVETANGPNWPDAVPVFLGPPSGVTGASAEWADDLRAAFQKAFGKRLALAGEVGWKADAPNLDAYFQWDPVKPLTLVEDSPLHTAVLTPGYNERGILGPDAPIQSRQNSRPYVAAWNEVGKQNPDWILLDSWNGYREGTELAPSRESGDRDLNLTRAALADLDSHVPLHARLISETVPRALIPGEYVRVEFQVQNAGVRVWPDTDTFLRYRWLKGDAVAASGDSVLTQEVRPRDQQLLGFLLPAVSATGPLPEADYQLEVTLFVPKSGTDPAGILSLGTYPVHVGPRPPLSAELLLSDLPSPIQSGSLHSVHVRIRNEGSDIWTKADHFVSYRWRKVPDSSSVDGDSIVAADKTAVRTPLKVDVIPGTLVDLDADVLADGEGGKPLEAWTSDAPWHYELEWCVTGPKGAAVAQGAQAVEVVDHYAGADLPLGSSLLKEMDADKPYELKVVVKNTGSERWKPNQVKVGCRWYYWDGVPMYLNIPEVPVKGPLGDLAPGEQALVRLPMQTPPIGGMFLVAVETVVDGVRATDSAGDRGTALFAEPVLVKGGGFRTLPIIPLYNTDGVSQDVLLTDGDFDGNKDTFPGQLLPPLVTPSEIQASIYPAGYLGPVVGRGLDANRRVPFEYPPKEDGAPNMVSCNGQVINVTIANCHSLHFLMASDLDQDIELRVTYASGNTQTVRVSMTAWDKAPVFDNETVGFHSPVRNGPYGVEAHDSYLKHYTVTCDPKSPISQIELPVNPHVKIMAITAEAW